MVLFIYFIFLILFKEILKLFLIKKCFFIFIMGMGDWGLGIGDWGLGPIPNPQLLIPKNQNPIPKNF